MPKEFDYPACCDKAVMLVMWMRKGVKEKNFDAANRDYDKRQKAADYTLDEPRPQVGPDREGWATHVEGVRNANYNVVACPFCGTRLDEHTPVRKR